jgi:hypothetical protein
MSCQGLVGYPPTSDIRHQTSELAQKVDRVYSGLADPGRTLVLCDNYGQAGAINYYTTKGIRTVSFNADYINWFELDEQYTSLIRVKTATRNSSELKETSPYFQSSSIPDSVTNQFAREYGTTIFLFTGAKIDINSRIRQEVNERVN